MEKPNNIQDLAQKWLDGSISPEEKAIFDKWYNQHDFSELKMDAQEGFDENALQERLRSEIKQQIPQFARAKLVRLWPRIAAAASVVLAIGFGTLYYANRHKEHNAGFAAVKNDVAPGKQGATLTLANGKKIRLAEAAKGKLAQEAGVSISKTADGQVIYQIEDSTSENKINTITTANGETYQVRLPDGSAVWLNAGSSLTYSASLLREGKRSVRLSGEGYFEIAKDKVHPFVVSTDRESVEVLGTHFNVSSYANDPLSRTTLQEGSVRMNGKTVLKPGEQAVVGAAGTLRIEEVDVDEALAWKNGKFVFADEDIESIMRKLARWYDVEVVYVGEKPDASFTASISRSDHIGKILSKLSFARKVKFKIEGRRVTVMR